MSSTSALHEAQERDQVLVDGQAWDREEFTAYWGKLGLEGQITALLKATLGPEEKQIGPSAQ